MAEYIDIGSEVKFYSIARLKKDDMAWIEKEYSTFPDETKNKVRVSFKVNSNLHRTDGPAVVIWRPGAKGETNLYYIKDLRVDPEKFKQCLGAPLERLPLYLNAPLLCEIAKARLRGETSSIKSNLHKDNLNEILKRCRVSENQNKTL